MLSSVEIVPFKDTITQNGAYHSVAPEGQAYSPIDISVIVPSHLYLSFVSFSLDGVINYVRFSNFTYTTDKFPETTSSNRVIIAITPVSGFYRVFVNFVEASVSVNIPASSYYFVQPISSSPNISFLDGARVTVARVFDSSSTSHYSQVDFSATFFSFQFSDSN